MHPTTTGESTVDAIDCGNQINLYVYSQKSANEFADYLKALKENYGNCYQENEMTDGNAAVTSAATFSAVDHTLHTYYNIAEGAIRVLVTEGASVHLPAVTNSDENPATGSVTPTVAQLNVTNSTGGGMGYVFTLADGSFLIYDGGESADDAQTLYDYLVSHNQRADGIVIAAWVLTHAHTDHYGAFSYFTKNHASNVRLEFVYTNAYCYDTVAAINSAIYNNDYLSNGLYSDCKAFNNQPKVVKVHTGQSIKVRNATVDILFTQEDLYPNAVNASGSFMTTHNLDANDLSLISKVSFTVGENVRSVLMMGDALNWALGKLTVYYSNTDVLNCDILQVPHHGNTGGLPTAESAGQTDLTSQLLKSNIGAGILLYPTDNEHFASYQSSDFNKALLRESGVVYYTAEMLVVIDLDTLSPVSDSNS